MTTFLSPFDTFVENTLKKLFNVWTCSVDGEASCGDTLQFSKEFLPECHYTSKLNPLNGNFEGGLSIGYACPAYIWFLWVPLVTLSYTLSSTTGRGTKDLLENQQ